MKVARIQINGASGQKSVVLGGILAKLVFIPTNPGGGIDITARIDGDTLVALTGVTGRRTLNVQVPVHDASGDPTAFSVFPAVNSLSVTLASADANTVLVAEAYYFE